MRSVTFASLPIDRADEHTSVRDRTIHAAVVALLAGMFWFTVGDVAVAAINCVRMRSEQNALHGLTLGVGHVVGAATLVLLYRHHRLRQRLGKAAALLESEWTVWGLLLAIAFVRLAWVVLVPNGPISDGFIYNNLAYRLMETGEYYTSRTRAHWPPGYPFWIAWVYSLCGYSLLAVKVSHVALAGIAEWCAWKWVARYTNKRTAGLALLLLVCWPSRTVHLDLISYDDLVIAAVMVSLVVMPDVRRTHGGWFRWVLAGVLLGYGCLTRSTVVLVIPAVVVWMALEGTPRRRIIAMAGLYTVAAAAMLAPWTVRNYFIFHRFVPLSTNAGYNFYHSFAPGGDGGYYAPATQHILDGMEPGEFDELQFNAIGFRLGLEAIRSDPWGAVHRMLVQKPVHYLGSDSVGASLDAYQQLWPASPWRANLVRGGTLFACNTYYIALMLCPLLFVRRVADGLRRRPAAALGLMIFLSGLAVHTLFQAQSRYHLIYLPFWTMCLAMLLTRREQSPAIPDTQGD